MSTWLKKIGANIDEYISNTYIDMEYLSKWFGSREGVTEYYISFRGKTYWWRLIVDQDFKPIKALIHLDDSDIQILDPSGDKLQEIVKRLKRMEVRFHYTGWIEEPKGETRTTKCHLCNKEVAYKIFTEEDEDWINDGNGLAFIGWIPWVRIDEKEVNVCDACSDKIEVNGDDIFQVI